MVEIGNAVVRKRESTTALQFNLGTLFSFWREKQGPFFVIVGKKIKFSDVRTRLITDGNSRLPNNLSEMLFWLFFSTEK